MPPSSEAAADVAGLSPEPAARGAREAILSQLPGDSILTKTLLGILLSPAAIILGTFILPLLFPFRIGEYLKFHYQKTRNQTLSLLHVFLNDGQERELPAENVQRLLDGLNDAT